MQVFPLQITFGWEPCSTRIGTAPWPSNRENNSALTQVSMQVRSRAASGLSLLSPLRSQNALKSSSLMNRWPVWTLSLAASSSKRLWQSSLSVESALCSPHISSLTLNGCATTWSCSLPRTCRSQVMSVSCWLRTAGSPVVAETSRLSR